MKRLSWILAIFFGLVFAGATALNAALLARARHYLAASSTSASSVSEPRSHHLMVILPSNDDSFFRGILEGVGAEAARSDVAVQVFRYPGQDSEEARRYFEIGIRSRVDGIVMYTARDDSDDDRFREAVRAGVVYIPVGTDAPLGERAPFIGSGSLLQGMEGGKLIGRRLGGRARVGLILDSSDSLVSEDGPLYRGLAAVLHGYPGAGIVDLEETQGDILSGEAVAEMMIRQHPEINAILCSSARDTVGAVQVLVDLNRVGSVLVIGADETDDVSRYIAKGIVAASVVRDSNRIGREAVNTFVRVRRGEAVPGPKEAGVFLVSEEESSR